MTTAAPSLRRRLAAIHDLIVEHRNETGDYRPTDAYVAAARWATSLGEPWGSEEWCDTVIETLGYWVRPGNKLEQLGEIFTRFGFRS